MTRWHQERLLPDASVVVDIDSRQLARLDLDLLLAGPGKEPRRLRPQGVGAGCELDAEGAVGSRAELGDLPALSIQHRDGGLIGALADLAQPLGSGTGWAEQN